MECLKKPHRMDLQLVSKYWLVLWAQGKKFITGNCSTGTLISANLTILDREMEGEDE